MAFYVTLSEQIRVFLYALIIGAVIGGVYDIFRISRVMLTGVGIGGEKTASKRLEKITEKLRSKKKNTRKRDNKLGKGLIFALVFVQDILFYLIATVIFIVFLYHANYGQARLYLYITSAFGFLLYYNTIGRLSARVSGFVVSLLRLILTAIMQKVIKPLVNIMKNAVSVPLNVFMKYRINCLSNKELGRILKLSKLGFENKNC